MRDKELHLKASKIHNEQPIEVRMLLCISAAQTQINTLETLKKNIMEDAKHRCSEINEWIKNIEGGCFGLRSNIEKYEKTQSEHEL